MHKTNQLYKGTLSTIILKLLAEQNRMYGYEITQKVKELTADKLVLTEGALYPALHKLEGDGILTTAIERVDGRPRKYYAITTKGKSQYKIKLQEMSDFVQQMQSLLQLKITT